MTIKEEREYEMIKANLTLNEETGRWQAGYPWIRDPAELPYNKAFATAVLYSLEKQLAKNSMQKDLYCKELKRMINSGVARRITKDELESYSGPKYFLAHHPVWNFESKSTPCRPVFNTSKKYKDKAMNDFLAKGPCLLNKLPGVLLRFRREKIAFVGDISKMFNCIDIPKTDQMMHLFLWKDMDQNVEPLTYAITTVNMGDRPSATIAQVALRETAEREAHNYPEEACIIKDNAYMDDILGSTTTPEEASRITENIDTILQNTGFSIKEWTYSYQTAAPSKSKNEELEKVLGLQFNITEDTLVFTITLSEEVNNKPATKRIILSTVHKIFDPLGLLGPFIVLFKILLREVWGQEEKFDWDDILPEWVQSQWEELKQELLKINDIKFTRALTPPGTLGKPKLIILSDGSKKAFGAVAYARWETERGIVMRIIMSKSRIAPLKIIDVVRLELCGALIGARLRSFIIKECNMEFEKIYHFVDSEIVKGMIGKGSYGFDTFEGNRLGGIERRTESTEWFWIPGSMNTADLLTRGCSPSKLGQNSEWQNAPVIFKEKEVIWTNLKPPSTKSKKNNPAVLIQRKEETLHTVGEVQTNDSLVSRINIGRFSRYTKLLQVTARVLSMYEQPRSFTNAAKDVTSANIEKAELFWIRNAQSTITKEELQTRYIRLGPMTREDGIITVGHRMEKWMEMSYNNNQLVLLPYTHPMSRLLVIEKHNRLHLSGYTGVQATACKVRLKFWIPRLDTMIKSIKHKCVDCRRLNKERLKESQSMAPLPIDRLKPAPPWYSVTIDLFGPIEIRGEVNKRSRGKAFGVIFTCNITRATHVDASSDYSTDSFLSAFRRFINLRRNPAKVRSDRGSQLVCANEELKRMISNVEMF